ncbi:serine hydrolase [Agromyces silvae]|uniref:serine hydrolase n=1 Tax=Agromyces silvae TaxID=3388266 RepID=UPI00280BB88A|nr:serine hydrolase [Agromyces protaetiae]
MTVIHPSTRPLDPLDALAERLEPLSAAQPFTTVWSVRDLATGAAISRDGERVVPSGSTRKVAILAAALAEAHAGRLDLEQTVVVDERFRDEVFTGSLQRLEPGVVLRVQDLLTLMIIWSDNLSTAHIVELVSLDTVNAYCARLGLHGTAHRHALIPALPADHPVEATNATTTDDQVALLTALVRGSTSESAAAELGLSPNLCRLALEMLDGQQHRNGLPAFLPNEVRVGHKSGRGWRDFSDVGVVYDGDRPAFAIAVATDGLSGTDADGLPVIVSAVRYVATVSRLAWEALVRDRAESDGGAA